eukprot:gene37015-48308_t
MIHLLDDSDQEVVTMVEQQIRTLGPSIIPVLESEWESVSLNPLLQSKIENLIHDFQWQSVKTRLQIWKESGGMDLLEGMWILATYRYPDYSFDDLKLEMDQLYYEVWPQMREEIHPMDQVKVLNAVIFDQLKFGPNTKNFHAANNSFINNVLTSKKDQAKVNRFDDFCHFPHSFSLKNLGAIFSMFRPGLSTEGVDQDAGKDSKKACGHRGPIYALEKGLDSLFYSAGSDGWVVQWNLAKPDLGKVIAQIEGSIYALKLDAEGILWIGHNHQGIQGIRVADQTQVFSIPTL